MEALAQTQRIRSREKTIVIEEDDDTTAASSTSFTKPYRCSRRRQCACIDRKETKNNIGILPYPHEDVSKASPRLPNRRFSSGYSSCFLRCLRRYIAFHLCPASISGYIALSGSIYLLYCNDSFENVGKRHPTRPHKRQKADHAHLYTRQSKSRGELPKAPMRTAWVYFVLNIRYDLSFVGSFFSCSS